MKRGEPKTSRGGTVYPKHAKGHWAKTLDESDAVKKRRLLDEEIDSGSDDGLPSSSDESGIGVHDTDETRLGVAQTYLQRFAAAASRNRQSDRSRPSCDSLSFDPAFDSGCDLVSDGNESNESEDEDPFLDAELKGTATHYLRGRLNGHANRQFYDDAAISLGLSEPIFYKGHKAAVTCVALPGSSVECGGCFRSRHAYSGAKDCCIIKWDLETGKKQVFKGRRNSFGGSVSTKSPSGHFRHVLGLCVTADESLVFSCGADHTIRAWDPRASDSTPSFELRGHKAPVTAVRINSNNHCSGGDIELLSCGADKSIKIWSTTCRAVSKHFFGHSSAVNMVDLLHPNNPISGGDDGTLRSWKLVQDTHTVYSSLGSPIDSVACLSPSLFACGSQLGLLSVFSSRSRRPLACCKVSLRDQAKAASTSTGFSAAAAASALAEVKATATESEGITSMKAIPHTNSFFVGSESGMVQLWTASKDAQGRVSHLAPVSSSFRFLGGVVNGIECAFAGSPSIADKKEPELLVCGVANEHRLGRWTVAEGVKNGIALFKVSAQKA